MTGAFDQISVVMRMTLVQLEIPNEIRGWVSAVNSIFIGDSNHLGEFESGATAALFGPVRSVVIGGVGTLLVAAGWSRQAGYGCFRRWPGVTRWWNRLCGRGLAGFQRSR
ncbi:MAG: hypothetical protein U0989_10890 [Azonexus sp.]|nr:hypothetical protein [Azonexus sp.]